MTQHIGIVACSAEGAALCYRTICLEGAALLGRHAHPEISMHTYPLSDYMRLIYEDRWDRVADLLVSSAEKLVRAGADFLICPDNTLHQAFDLVVPPLSRAVAAHRGGGRRGGRAARMGLPRRPRHEVPDGGARGLTRLLPEADERERVNQIIFDELVNGRFLDPSRAEFTRIIARLRDRGCDAVVLGCTEIPLLVAEEDSPLPILDSTRLLARGALERAIGR